jgi:hypothetical protein
VDVHYFAWFRHDGSYVRGSRRKTVPIDPRSPLCQLAAFVSGMTNDEAGT